MNRLRSQVGRCKQSMVEWGLLRGHSIQCACNTAPQTMAHLLDAPRARNRALNLT